MELKLNMIAALSKNFKCRVNILYFVIGVLVKLKIIKIILQFIK